MMNFDEVNIEQVNLQTQSCKYDKPPSKSATESQPKVSIEPLQTPNSTLQIPQPKFEVTPKIPKGSLHRNATSSKATNIYSIVDDLVQSPTTMSMLEVLQTFPSQRKYLLYSLGDLDLQDDQMIIFHVDK